MNYPLEYQSKFAIVIPVYNEENNVEVIADKLDELEIPYVFIDDGSTDKTATQLWLKEIPALCYYPNRGKFFAFKLGAKYLINEDYEWIMIIDGDGQMSIEDIEKFDNALLFDEDKTDIFIGNRLNNPKDMPLIRRLTNQFMSWIVSKLTGQYIPDSQCGFRLYNKRVIEELNLVCDRFDGESEVLIKAGCKGMKIKSIPIQCIYQKGRKSKIHPIKDTYRFVKLLFKILKINKT